MAIGDVTITDANTKPSVKAGFNQSVVQIGEAVGGKLVPLYMDPADNKYYKCVSNDSAKYAAVCLSWEGGSTDDLISVIGDGSRVEVGSILSKGRRYVVSVTAGIFTIDSNLTTGDYAFTIGVAESDSVLQALFRDDSNGVAI